MTNRRAPGGSDYRAFLRSPAWFARRARWFRTAKQRGDAIECHVCGAAGTQSSLELHHLDYAGVTIVDGKWRAFEPHTDLVPMHPSCHEILHRLVDRDTVLSRQRTRRDATAIAAETIRHALTRQESS